MVKRRSRAETSRKSIETHSGQHLRPMWRRENARRHPFSGERQQLLVPREKGQTDGEAHL